MKLGMNIDYNYDQPVWVMINFCSSDIKSIYVQLTRVDNITDTNILRNEEKLNQICKSHKVHVIRYSSAIDQSLLKTNSIEFESHEICTITVFDSYTHAKKDYDYRYLSFLKGKP